MEYKGYDNYATRFPDDLDRVLDRSSMLNSVSLYASSACGASLTAYLLIYFWLIPGENILWVSLVAFACASVAIGSRFIYVIDMIKVMREWDVFICIAEQYTNESKDGRSYSFNLFNLAEMLQLNVSDVESKCEKYILSGYIPHGVVNRVLHILYIVGDEENNEKE